MNYISQKITSVQPSNGDDSGIMPHKFAMLQPNET